MMAQAGSGLCISHSQSANKKKAALLVEGDLKCIAGSEV